MQRLRGHDDYTGYLIFKIKPGHEVSVEVEDVCPHERVGSFGRSVARAHVHMWPCPDKTNLTSCASGDLLYTDEWGMTVSKAKCSGDWLCEAGEVKGRTDMLYQDSLWCVGD